MFKHSTFIAILFAAGCTSVTKYDVILYKDCIMSKNGRAVYVLTQKSVRTSTYFYAVFDNYSESDSFVVAHLQKLSLDGNMEKEIMLDVETGGFETYNDSVILLRDTSDFLLKVNLESNTVSRLNHRYGYPIVLDNSTASYYTLSAERQSVSIFSGAWNDERTTLRAAVKLDSAVFLYGSAQYRYTNHLIGESIIFLHTFDSMFLCNVESGDVARFASVAGSVAVLPLTPRKFICSTGFSAGVYTLYGDSLFMTDTLVPIDYGCISPDTSATYGVRVETVANYPTPLTRVILVDLKSGSEKILCAGSVHTVL